MASAAGSIGDRAKRTRQAANFGAHEEETEQSIEESGHDPKSGHPSPAVQSTTKPTARKPASTSRELSDASIHRTRVEGRAPGGDNRLFKSAVTLFVLAHPSGFRKPVPFPPTCECIQSGLLCNQLRHAFSPQVLRLGNVSLPSLPNTSPTTSPRPL